MSVKFHSDSFEIDNQKVYASVSELKNAILVLCWIGDEPKLGSVTISLPKKTSSQLIGNRNEILGRMIGERLAKKSGKLAMVSTNLPIGFDSSKKLFDLIDKLTGEYNE
jgi:hypothetical protein